MVTNTLPETLTRLLDPLQQCLTVDVARRIADLRADPEVQLRLDTLAEKNSEGTLTPEEEKEYVLLVQAGNLIAIIQAKARRVVRGST